MGRYLPYSGRHSIQEVVVAMHFRGIFSPEAIGQAHSRVQAELKEVLPRSADIQMQQLQVNQGVVGQQQSRLGGFVLSKVKADAKPARVLRLVENNLTVNFLDYENWDSTLQDSLEHIRTVLTSLSLVDNPVIAFSLRYIDRYTFDGTFDGPQEEPQAEMLLRRGSEYVTERCFKAGPLWHCNSGWFEPREAGDRILNQLNVGSAIVDQAPTVTVDHNAICQLKAPRQTVESLFQPSSGAAAGLENVLNELHDRNGTILRDMLVQEMLEKIGMER